VDNAAVENVEARRTSYLRILAEPGHVNFGGKVHGGQLMKWLDQAGYACAAQWSGGYAVTVYVAGIHFMKPILVGWVVELQARVIHTGSSSMHIAIDVFARDPRSASATRCGHSVIVFVGLDDEGRPRPVPKWVPRDEHDRQMETYALRLVALRKAMEEEMRDRLHLAPDPAPAR